MAVVCAKTERDARDLTLERVRVFAALPLPHATQYLDKHSLQKRTEDVLNMCVGKKPDEPLSFMVRRERET